MNSQPEDFNPQSTSDCIAMMFAVWAIEEEEHDLDSAPGTELMGPFEEWLNNYWAQDAKYIYKRAIKFQQWLQSRR